LDKIQNQCVSTKIKEFKGSKSQSGNAALVAAEAENTLAYVCHCCCYCMLLHMLHVARAAESGKHSIFLSPLAHQEEEGVAEKFQR
jgi:hypothetical protein